MTLRDMCDTAYVLQVADIAEGRDEFDEWLESPLETPRRKSDRERQLTLMMGG